jgi:NADPH:quinone reductase-like Zn-dependent oxidoreductase
LPSRLGAESVGKVNKIGKNVKDFNVGDIVLPLDRENWVQQKMVLASNLVLLPKNVDILQLSMMKVNPATAYLMIKKYVKLNKNDWIIQDAANSGVGHSVISIAKNLDLKTINIVRRVGLEEGLKNIGADVVLLDNNNLSDSVKKLTDNANVKLALDAVGGDQVLRIGDCLEDEATILNYGLLSGKNIEISSHQTVFKRIILTGFWLMPWLQNMEKKEIIEMYAYLSSLIEKDIIHVPVEKTYPIEDIKQAVAHAAKYGRNGKIIVTPNGDNFSG